VATTSILSRIIKITNAYPYTVSQLTTFLKMPYWTVYYTVQKGEQLGVLETRKEDGLLWVRSTHQQPQLNLICKGANFKQNYHVPRLPTPTRSSWMRRVACYQATKILSAREVMPLWDKLFAYYLHVCKHKIIVLAPKVTDNFFGPELQFYVKNRFNDYKRKKKIKEQYDNCWEVATKKYKRGVLVTLTVDPKLQDNLWQVNKTISKKFNRLLSYFTRKHKKRPVYINCFEFQKNGRLHLHVIVFGKPFLIPQKQLSKLWQKYGMGEIVSLMSIKNNRGAWEWVKNKPKDSKGESPKEYLQKYLDKSLYKPEQLTQYWVYNTRFFTYSRSLAIAISYKTSISKYIYIGSYYDYDLIPWEVYKNDYNTAELELYYGDG